MKSFAFLLLSIVFGTGAWAQSSWHYGFGIDLRSVNLGQETRECYVVMSVAPFGPMYMAGIKPMDLILSIDGTPTTTYGPINLLHEKPSATFVVKRVGGRTFDATVSALEIKAEQGAPEAYFAEYGESGFDLACASKIEVITDPDAALYDYASFDFEFTEQNPLMQKELAGVIEKMLTNVGLRRDRENPDLLIFIDYFGDRREQYVPPSQQVSTRYKTNYNLFSSKPPETRQYIESTTVGDYTRVEYMYRLSISMLDAAKAKAGAKVTPMVWRGSYMVVNDKKITAAKFTENTGEAMLACFPAKNVFCIRFRNYWYTGIVFDAQQAGRIAAVYPDSPAAKAGLKVGDEITGSNPPGYFGPGYGKFLRTSYKKISEMVAKDGGEHHYGGYVISGLIERPEFSSLSPYPSIYNVSYIPHYGEAHNSVIQFKVKSEDGKTRKVDVNALWRTHKTYRLK